MQLHKHTIHTSNSFIVTVRDWTCYISGELLCAIVDILVCFIFMFRWLMGDDLGPDTYKCYCIFLGTQAHVPMSLDISKELYYKATCYLGTQAHACRYMCYRTFLGSYIRYLCYQTSRDVIHDVKQAPVYGQATLVLSPLYIHLSKSSEECQVIFWEMAQLLQVGTSLLYIIFNYLSCMCMVYTS